MTSNKKRKVAWQFQNTNFPGYVLYLLMENSVTSKDLLILAVVKSLVRQQGTIPGHDGLGAFISNGRLAEIIGANEKYVSGRISHLARLGLLIIVEMKGQRYLEPEWVRCAAERTAMEGVYGVLFRRAHAKTVARLEAREIYTKEQEGSGKPEGGGSGKPEGGVQENLNHNNTVERLRSKKNEETRSAENGGGEAHNRPSGLFGRNNKPTKTKSSDPKDVAAARQLKEALRKNNRQVIESSKWPESFRLLREEDRQDYTEVLNWFCEHCSKEDERKLGLPSIASARQFRKHYGTWIEPIYNKTAKPNPHKKRPMENGQPVFTDEEIRAVRKRVDNETAAKFGVNRRDQCTPEVWEKIDWFKARLKEKIDEEYGGDITNRLLSTERMA